VITHYHSVEGLPWRPQTRRLLGPLLRVAKVERIKKEF